MHKRVVWTFTEDDVAEGIGKVVDVGVAEVVEIVEWWVAKECGLASSLRLECDSRDEVYCNGLIGENNDSGYAVIHIGGDLDYCFGCTLLFPLIIQISQCPLGEDDVVEWSLLIWEFETGKVVRLAGAPTMLRYVIHQQYLLFCGLSLHLPHTSTIIPTGRMRNQ